MYTYLRLVAGSWSNIYLALLLTVDPQTTPTVLGSLNLHQCNIPIFKQVQLRMWDMSNCTNMASARG